MDRLERLRLFLTRRRLEAAVLTKPANIAAFFRGAQAFLGFRQEPPGRVAVCLTRDAVVLLGNRTEVARMAEDELSWLDGLATRPFRWDDWNMRGCVKTYLDSEGITRVGDDMGAFGENVGRALEEMYYPLTDEEVNSMRQLATDAAAIVESAAKNLAFGTSELAVAGEVTGQLVSQGIWPELIMVAGDNRIRNLRHCVPKQVPIAGLALLSATVQRRGLYVSLTRLACRGPAPVEWRRLQESCNRIDATAISLSKPAARVGEIFKAIMRGYEQEGYADEWMAHHQGGPAGFYGRDYKATQQESRCLVARQPIAWNPTVHGAKSEDTILTTEPGQGPEVLTETGSWVYYNASFGGARIRRPMILER